MTFAMHEIALGLGLVVVSAALTAVLIVVLRPLLQRYALAKPNPRSSHAVATPQGAGIAVVAVTIGLALFVLLWADSGSTSLAMIFVAATLMAGVGAADDIWNVNIGLRLLLQVAASTIVIVALPPELHIVPHLPWWVERVSLGIVVVWFVNLTNFMDGIDWMTVAEMVPISAAIAVLGAMDAVPLPAVLVALALGGAILGFAPFNKPVAQLFLGDVGSLPIGMLLGWLLILLAGRGHWAAALLLPLYYVADASITLSRRVLDGEPFWQAHRSHFYQRALDRGFSVIEVVARVFAVNVGLATLAITTVAFPDPTATTIGLLCGSALVGWLLALLAGGKR